MYTMHPDDILTTAEVCRLLMITRPTLYHWMEEGKLVPWKKLGNGSTFLFLRNQLTHNPPRKYSRNEPQNAAISSRSAGAPLSFQPEAGQPPVETCGKGAAINHACRTIARIFLVSQDAAVVEQVCPELQNQGYQVSVAGDFSRIGTIFKTAEVPDMIILDLEFNSKFVSRWKLFAEIKKLAGGSNQPSPAYLLLSGRQAASRDAARAFENGAWDFLKRPLASSVLTARVRLALRRRYWSELDASPRGHVLTSRDELIALDPNSRILGIRNSLKRSASLSLTRKESELLCLFLKRPGMIFSKTMLLEIIWGYAVNIKTRTVDCHIKNLRQKLYPHGNRIETHYNSGYRFIDT